MDLEMTGLEPARHVIVEIATLITDDDLALVEEGPDLVVHATPDDVAGMDDFVRTMHTRSGLLAENSMLGRALHALVGYSDRPCGVQLVAYVTTLTILLVSMRLIAQTNAAESGQTKTAARRPAT